MRGAPSSSPDRVARVAEECRCTPARARQPPGRDGGDARHELVLMPSSTTRCNEPTTAFLVPPSGCHPFPVDWDPSTSRERSATAVCSSRIPCGTSTLSSTEALTWLCSCSAGGTVGCRPS